MTRTQWRVYLTLMVFFFTAVLLSSMVSAWYSVPCAVSAASLALLHVALYRREFLGESTTETKVA
jgi:hypothetical protein